MASTINLIRSGVSRDTRQSEMEMIAPAGADRAAFAAIYQQFKHDIYRYCYRCLGSREDAEDATSQVFIKAMTNFGRMKHDNVRAWIFRIAHDTAIDFARTRHPADSIDEASTQQTEHASPESAALEHELRREVISAIASLSSRDQQLVNLRLAGLNAAEIAVVLGISHGAVRTAHHRALGRLREVLENVENAHV